MFYSALQQMVSNKPDDTFSQWQTELALDGDDVEALNIIHLKTNNHSVRKIGKVVKLRCK